MNVFKTARELQFTIAERLLPEVAQCEHRNWRATWTPDEWAAIFYDLTTLRPSIEAAGIDVWAIRHLCTLAFARPKGDPALIDTDNELWRKAGISLAEFLKLETAEQGNGVDDDAVLSPAKLAELFGVPLAPLQKRLERWRKKNLMANGAYIENPDAGPRDAKYHYRVGSIRHLIGNPKNV